MSLPLNSPMVCSRWSCRAGFLARGFFIPNPPLTVSIFSVGAACAGGELIKILACGSLFLIKAVGVGGVKGGDIIFCCWLWSSRLALGLIIEGCERLRPMIGSRKGLAGWGDMRLDIADRLCNILCCIMAAMTASSCCLLARNGSTFGSLSAGCGR